MRRQPSLRKTNVWFVSWQDENFWLGYLEDYPDYPTQGGTLEELEENLQDILSDVTEGYIPEVRAV